MVLTLLKQCIHFRLSVRVKKVFSRRVRDGGDRVVQFNIPAIHTDFYREESATWPSDVASLVPFRMLQINFSSEIYQNLNVVAEENIFPFRFN